MHDEELTQKQKVALFAFIALVSAIVVYVGIVVL